MSWRGLKVAKLFGHKLPAFANRAEAEQDLYRVRDERLQIITKLANVSCVFSADYSPESLKRMEKWYFDLWESDGFARIGIPRDEFERCMASYFCMVLVRNCPDAKWEVEEFAFERGKFEIGVQRGLIHVMRSRFTDHYKMPGNKKREKIYRMYQVYTA